MGRSRGKFKLLSRRSARENEKEKEDSFVILTITTIKKEKNNRKQSGKKGRGKD